MSQPRGRCFALPPLLSAPHTFLSCPPPPGPPVPPPTPLLQRFLPSPESLSPLTTATLAWHRPGGGSNSRGKPPSRRPVAASPHPTLAQARVAATFPTTTTTAVPRVGRHSTPHPTPHPRSEKFESGFPGGAVKPTNVVRGVTPGGEGWGTCVRSRLTPRLWEVTTEDLAHVALGWRARLGQPPTNPSVVLHAPAYSHAVLGHCHSKPGPQDGCVLHAH